MKISVERELLVNALSNLQRAVTPRASLPILEGVLLSAEEGKLTLMAYNMEISMKKELPIVCSEQGDIVISARILFEIIRKVRGTTIQLQTDDHLVCHISCGAAVFDIMGMASEDFPEMPNVAEYKTVTLSSEDLKSMVRQTSFAAAQMEGTRPILTGLDFEIENGQLKVVAIDGNRLAIRKKAINSSEKISFVVSSRAISEAVKIIGEEEQSIVIKVGSRNISFEIDGYILTSRLLEGAYIDYSRSIPQSFAQEIKINVPQIIEIIERISLVIVNDQIKSPVRCALNEDCLTFSCTSSVGRATDCCDIELKGSEFEIGFNNRYLLDALKATEEDEVLVRFNGPNAAAVITPLEGVDYLYLVLPIILKWWKKLKLQPILLSWIVF